MKDFYIPVAIILAGASIGAGLYFGGDAPSPAYQAGNTPPAYEAQEPADTTAQVRAVDDADHIRGSLDAPVKIVEYSDFDCPFCTRIHETLATIVESNDQVAWVYRHFPLEQLHPNAEAVSVASECVAELGGQEAFWTFTDGYYEARGAGSGAPHTALIPELVLAAGVEQAAFTECFESGRTQPLVQEDYDNAVATGGRGTPWNVVIGPTGKTYPLNGALPQAAIEQLIEFVKQDA